MARILWDVHVIKKEKGILLSNRNLRWQLYLHQWKENLLSVNARVYVCLCVEFLLLFCIYIYI